MESLCIIGFPASLWKLLKCDANEQTQTFSYWLHLLFPRWLIISDPDVLDCFFFYNICSVISSDHSWLIDANASFEHNTCYIFKGVKRTQENKRICFSPVQWKVCVFFSIKTLTVYLGLTVRVGLKVSNCKYAAYKKHVLIKTTVRRHFVWYKRTKRNKKRKTNHSCWNYWWRLPA